jgi:hypothetical protein
MRYSLAVLITSLGLASSPAWAGYVAADWATNQAILLDNTFTPTGSFALVTTNPNGAAADESRIYIGSFVSQAIYVFDYVGNPITTFTDPYFTNLQGLEVVGNELAVASTAAGDGVLNFYDKTTGAFTRSITNAALTGTIEGLAYDGTLLWALGDTLLGFDPNTGALISEIPNAASGESFGGTGLTSAGPGRLAIGSASGDWFVVSTADGSVISSGNTPGVQFFGLGTLSDIPEPGTVALLSTGLLALAAFRARRRA